MMAQGHEGVKGGASVKVLLSVASLTCFLALTGMVREAEAGAGTGGAADAYAGGYAGAYAGSGAESRIGGGVGAGRIDWCVGKNSNA